MTLSDAKRGLIAQRLRQRPASDVVTIPRRPDGTLPPLSYAQERLWFMEQAMSGGSAAYTISLVLNLDGPLNPGTVQAALDTVAARHETLRSRMDMTEDGRPVLVIDPVVRVPLRIVGPAGVHNGSFEGRLDALLADEADRPFDIARDTLVRALLVRLADDRHALQVVAHHAVIDGWSTGLFVDEWIATYRALAAGRPAPMPPLAVQYGDYAAWQRDRLTGPVLGRDLEYWLEQLAGVPPLALPTDRTRPAVQTFGGAGLRFHLDGPLVESLRKLGASNGATLYVTLLAVYRVLLHRYSGQEDFAVGSPVAGRLRPEVEPLIGMFANVLAMRGRITGSETFLDILDATRRAVLEALAHQEVPFEKVVADLGQTRDVSRSPLFQVTLALQNYPFTEPDRSAPGQGLDVSWHSSIPRTTRFDLEWYAFEGPDGLDCLLMYNTYLLERATAAGFIGHLRELAAALVAAPGVPVREPGPVVPHRTAPAIAPAEPAAVPRAAPPASRPEPAAATTAEGLVAAIWREVLGVGRVDLDDDFFDLGGHSMLAVQVVARLRKATGTGRIAVMDVFTHKTVRALAALLDLPSDGRPRPLLQELTPPVLEQERVRSYVCVPYGGGSAVVYQPLADALPAGHTLYAVAVPGHDIGLDESALPFDELARLCVEEVLATVRGPLVLYGHCTLGGALTVEVARQLRAAGRPAEAIYLGAILPFARPKLLLRTAGASARLDRLRSNRAYVAWLAAFGVDLTDLEPAQAARIVANLRQGNRSAEDYFTVLFESPADDVGAPIISVVGDRDQTTQFYPEQYREWGHLTGTTAAVVLDEAGHYFIKYRSAELAEIVTGTHTMLARGEVGPLARAARGPDAGWWLAEAHDPGRPGLGPEPANRLAGPRPVAPGMPRFLAVAAGQLVSLVGSALTQWAIPLYVFLHSHSLAQFGLLAATGLVPGLLVAPLAGAVVDRSSRRAVMVAADIASAAVQLVLLLLLWSGSLHIWHVYPLMVALGVATTFQRLAYASAVAQLVPKRFLGHAIGLSQFATGTAQLVVPLVAAGLLATIGLAGMVAIDVLSYTMAIAVVAAVSFPDVMAWRRREGLLTEILEGMRYSWRRPGLRGMLLFFALVNVFLAVPMMATAPIVLTLGDLSDVGRVSFVSALGAVAGGLAMVLWGGPRRNRMGGVLLSAAGMGAAATLIGLRPSMPVIAAGAFGTTMALTLLNGIYALLIQIKTPQRYHGRVFALNQTLAWSTLPIGFAVVGPLAAAALTPLMQPGGALAGSVGAVVGTGPGRGVALATVIAGFAILAVALVARSVPVIARFDEGVPDATADDLVGVEARRRRLASDPVTPQPEPHLAPLPDTDWGVWRWGLVRSAGFPVTGLAELSATDCAAAADAVIEGTGNEHEYREAFHAATLALATAVHGIAAQPAFREAMTWQNPTAVSATAGVLRDGPDAPRNERRRRREEIIAKYWQRYCGKNDSIGFFGPMCWVRLDPEGPPVIGASGPNLVSRRFVHFEWWALDALARTFAKDTEARIWLPLARQPHLDLDGRTLRRPGGDPVPLTAAEEALLRLADGTQAAAEVADSLVGESALGFREVEDVYALADRLVDRGLMRWGLDLPYNLDAEGALRRWLDGIGDDAVRRRMLAPLDRLAAGRDEVAAAGTPERLATALAVLEHEFSMVTGAPARRRGGQTYAARTLVHLDATRDLSIVFGQAVLRRLAPLAPLLQSARWLTAALAEAYTTILADLHAELAEARGSASVPFEDLWFLAQGPLVGASRPSDAVVEEYLRRWHRVLGLDTVPDGTRRLELPPESLRAKAAAEFQADRPGWALARIHSPDLHLCAPDWESLARGEFTVVLGELHIGVAALDTHFFRLGHPAPQELVEAMARDLPQSRIHLALSDEIPRNTARNADWLNGPDDVFLGFAPGPGVPVDRLVPVTALSVEPDGAGRLVVRTRDGRAWPVMEAFAVLAGQFAFDTWKLAGRGGHSPRITVDGLVLLRETWRTTVGETGLADAKGEQERMLAVRRWRRALDLPERVFLRVATETKPCYVDLTSPVYARILCNLLRGAQQTAGPQTEVVATEMLPIPDDAWLTDAAGHRYTSELRLQLRDPATAPVAWSEPTGGARNGRAHVR